MSIEKALLVSNARLKSGGLGLWIEVLNDRLCLRGNLPPRPDSNKTEHYKQRIYLGYPITPETIKQAEKDAKSIRIAVVENRFDWYDWNKSLRRERDKPALDMAIGAIAERFEKDYFTRRAKNPKSLTTFNSEYLPIFKKLPQNQELTEAVIMAAIATTTPETRQRKRYVMALGALAKFIDFDIDISDYGKGYTPAKLEIRDLPTDLEIIMHWELIPTIEWKNCYALMATFGIRPHETMRCDLNFLPDLHVLENTKTGFRIVKPLHEDWIGKFNINAQMLLPKITGRTNREFGDRIGTQLKRYGIPFPSYNLRHCYAIRASIEYQLPLAISARMMGHSAAEHQKTYLRHIKDKTVNDAYRSAIDNKKPIS